MYSVNKIVESFIDWSWSHHIPWYILLVGITSGLAGWFLEQKAKSGKTGG